MSSDGPAMPRTACEPVKSFVVEDLSKAKRPLHPAEYAWNEGTTVQDDEDDETRKADDEVVEARTAPGL